MPTKLFISYTRSKDECNFVSDLCGRLQYEVSLLEAGSLVFLDEVIAEDELWPDVLKGGSDLANVFVSLVSQLT
jgi:hypothetical protein